MASMVAFKLCDLVLELPICSAAGAGLICFINEFDDFVAFDEPRYGTAQR